MSQMMMRGDAVFRLARRLGFRARSLWASTALLPVLPASAHAQTSDAITLFGQSFQTSDVIQFALFCGAMAAALVASILIIRQRSRAEEDNRALRGKLAGLTSRVNQLEAVSADSGQLALIWSGAEEKPEIIGRLEQGSGAPEQQASFMAFGKWLEPAPTTNLEQAIENLREKGEPFSLMLETKSGVPLEAQGRTSGGSAIVRFSNLSTERTEHYRLTSEHSRLSDRVETVQAFLDTLPDPVWLRNENGRLTWANRAYMAAIGKPSLDADKDAELFGSQALETVQAALEADSAYGGRVSTVVDGERIVFDVMEVAGASGSAGMAQDQTETDNASRELSKTIRSHEETLDGLNTAVAMFDENQRLAYYNQAFRALWDFETGFLENYPDMSLFLQHLRSEGKVPEQPDWQRWKNDILSAYQALEPVEHWWHLPDNRTLRVIANPHPRGGLTWVFENLTERIDLESRYTTLMRVQGETLDHLSEGVAVFAADGHLELSNPAFMEFWGLGSLVEAERLHISSIQRSWPVESPEYEAWANFAGIITSFDEQRASEEGRFQIGEQILSWHAVPLPNGQTMLTFLDMTAPDQIERALRERNDALERTAALRNRFIEHVSYELRSPLTNIVGFTELLQMEGTGALNDKQTSYVGNIGQSSQKLMEITDDILDLAAVDAGMFTLDIGEIDLAEMMRSAADRVASRFEEHGIELLVRVEPDIGTIHADRDSLLRVLVNILKNAAAYAPEGSSVPFSCQRVAEDVGAGRAQGISITVRDSGPGMDEDALAQAFERFHADNGGRTRGAGLGLSLARSFISLHDGDIEIRSRPGNGTVVEIYLPETPRAARIAAQ